MKNKQARFYNVEDLLVDTYYSSLNSNKSGIIESAEKFDGGHYYPGCQNYLVSYNDNGTSRYAVVTVKLEA